MEFLTNGPVDPGVILPFLAAVVLIELTPGPNMTYLALVAASDAEIVIHRKDPQAGELHLHFPRLGFDVVAV